MPWTKTDIFNQALRHLGITEFVTNPDSVTDTHANFLRGFWDEQVRTHLEKGEWSFSKTYYSLGTPTGEESPFEHLPFIYQRPPNCLVFRGIYSTLPDVRIPWEQGITPEGTTPQHRIYTNVDDAIGVYTRDVTEFLSVWDYAFGGMIAAIMAYHYSGVRAPKKSKFIWDIYKAAFAAARAVSAKGQGDLKRSEDFHPSDYVSGRS